VWGVNVGAFVARVLLCLTAAILLAAAAAAQEQPAADVTAEAALVSNVFVDTDLRQALQDVGAQAGVNIIADPSVQGLVSVELADVTVDKALELLLAGTEFQVERTPDYYLVYSPDQSAGAFTDVAATRIATISHVAAETARSLLPDPLQRYVRVDQAGNTLAVTAPPELLARIMQDLAQIDRPAEDTVLVPLEFVTAATAANLLPASLQRFVRADAERNALAVSAPIASRAAILDQIALLDVPRGPGSFNLPAIYPTQVVKLNHAKAASTFNLLPATVQAYVKADEESNTLAVSAPDILVDRILADIATIDAPRKHIMLEARVVILERADLLDFGGEWDFPRIEAGTAVSDLGWPWEVRIGYTPDRDSTTALALRLNLLTQNNEATIIASPQVLAQDGKQAEIRVTTEEYFQITSENENAVFFDAELEKIETGTILGITPQIGPNGELTLDMNIEVSDVVARGQQNLPVVNRRIARSIVQIENGGTAAIAGLSDTKSQVGREGVPGAAGLPLLGRAFRTDTLRHFAGQVAVFITATIVEEGDGRFETGRTDPPPLRVRDDARYTEELKAALDRLGAGLH
jgi:type II secretory pathway component GspD/PulD (secretin)